MFGRLGTFLSGLHFRFLMLVVGFAVALLAAQMATDTAGELGRVRSQRIDDALKITGVVARTLEKRFDELDLGEVEEVLAVIAGRSDVKRLTVTDRELGFLLDGDPMTAPVPATDLAELQLLSLRTGSLRYRVHLDGIEISEPLIADGRTIGSVMVEFATPGLVETLLPILYRKLGALTPILVTGLFFAVGLVSQVTAPLSRLSRAARAFSEGTLDQDFRIEGAREVRQLGEAFQQMVVRLKSSIEQISRVAYVDRTTQLPNREYFQKELGRALDNARHNGTTGAVMFIDLDGFKQVNDTLGHEVGDRLLSAFSERTASIIRSGDTLMRQFGADEMRRAAGLDGDGRPDEQTFARLGGDEFTIILAEVREETDAGLVAQRILDATTRPFNVGGTQVRIGASIGVATFPRDGSDAKSILRSADMAMYEAKAAGKSTYRFYSAELNRRVNRRLELENALKSAIEQGQLELHYQPKIECRSGRPVAAEALLRWQHPERGIISPGDFMGIAVKTGLILPLGRWVLEEACRQARRFQDAGIDLALSVNIAMQQFEKADFAQEALAIVGEAGIDAHRLEFEVTERMATADPQRALDHLRRLKRAGVRFTVEDFGAGYSNLSQLSRLPVDFFKIDVSFLEALSDELDDRSRRVARSVLALAKSLHCAAIAQGVETQEQYQFLVDAGCDYAQGYLFARPMPAAELTDWLAAQKPGQWARAPSLSARREKAVA